MTATLELSCIRKSFGGFAALDGASFAAERGEVHALLGENGAGKSSLMNVAAGLYAADAGRLAIDGEEVRLGGPRDARALGIGMVQQHFRLVKTCTVAENVLLANPRPGYARWLATIESEIERQATELGFEIDPTAPVHVLSVAEQQRVELLKVLIAGARILILDEPTAVLTEAEADRLLHVVRALAARGTTVVLVTHKLREVMSATDRVTVMRGGRSLATLRSAETTMDRLAELIVGAEVAAPRRMVKRGGDHRLNVVNLRCARADGHVTVNDMSVLVRDGEIYGIAGVSGNGQSELVDALMGVRHPVGGSIEIVGLGDVTHVTPDRRRDLSIAIIPADRYTYGLAGGLSVIDNYAIGEVHTGRYGGFARAVPSAMKGATDAAIREFEVMGVHSLQQRAALLSGGNAQKLVLARELGRNPAVIVAHNPSRGLDLRACAAVHERLLAARDRGAAVVLVSEDLDEIISISDRIGVMARGRIAGEFGPPFDRQAIGRAMIDHA
ncbi:MAG: ABC transporter ATP-binding protein [Alphaproteobacteria bacterium]|nr:ABC transporter ATP-binding protein [Alphaproteobacteria bacterium]